MSFYTHVLALVKRLQNGQKFCATQKEAPVALLNALSRLATRTKACDFDLQKHTTASGFLMTEVHIASFTRKQWAAWLRTHTEVTALFEMRKARQRTMRIKLKHRTAWTKKRTKTIAKSDSSCIRVQYNGNRFVSGAATAASAASADTLFSSSSSSGSAAGSAVEYSGTQSGTVDGSGTMALVSTISSIDGIFPTVMKSEVLAVLDEFRGDIATGAPTDVIYESALAIGAARSAKRRDAVAKGLRHEKRALLAVRKRRDAKSHTRTQHVAQLREVIEELRDSIPHARIMLQKYEAIGDLPSIEEQYYTHNIILTASRLKNLTKKQLSDESRKRLFDATHALKTSHKHVRLMEKAVEVAKARLFEKDNAMMAMQMSSTACVANTNAPSFSLQDVLRSTDVYAPAFDRNDVHRCCASPEAMLEALQQALPDARTCESIGVSLRTRSASGVTDTVEVTDTTVARTDDAVHALDAALDAALVPRFPGGAMKRRDTFQRKMQCPRFRLEDWLVGATLQVCVISMHHDRSNGNHENYIANLSMTELDALQDMLPGKKYVTWFVTQGHEERRVLDTAEWRRMCSWSVSVLRHCPRALNNGVVKAWKAVAAAMPSNQAHVELLPLPEKRAIQSLAGATDTAARDWIANSVHAWAVKLRTYEPFGYNTQLNHKFHRSMTGSLPATIQMPQLWCYVRALEKKDTELRKVRREAHGAADKSISELCVVMEQCCARNYGHMNFMWRRVLASLHASIVSVTKIVGKVAAIATFPSTVRAGINGLIMRFHGERLLSSASTTGTDTDGIDKAFQDVRADIEARLVALQQNTSALTPLTDTVLPCLRRIVAAMEEVCDDACATELIGITSDWYAEEVRRLVTCPTYITIAGEDEAFVDSLRVAAFRTQYLRHVVRAAHPDSMRLSQTTPDSAMETTCSHANSVLAVLETLKALDSVLLKIHGDCSAAREGVLALYEE